MDKIIYRKLHRERKVLIKIALYVSVLTCLNIAAML